MVVPLPMGASIWAWGRGNGWGNAKRGLGALGAIVPAVNEVGCLAFADPPPIEGGASARQPANARRARGEGKVSGWAKAKGPCWTSAQRRQCAPPAISHRSP